MIKVAVTQRVDISVPHGERRDALDQRWIAFFDCVNVSPIILPNNLESARKLLENEDVRGIVLTGGNDLVDYGGNASERDELESFLIALGMREGIPTLGVCRGMQMIQHHFGITLQAVSGHVLPSQTIKTAFGKDEVNSFHNYGSFESNDELVVWATSSDGLVKAVRHKDKAILGIMWHPERIEPFRQRDKDMFKEFFGSDT